jgi:hypothetical protein
VGRQNARRVDDEQGVVANRRDAGAVASARSVLGTRRGRRLRHWAPRACFLTFLMKVFVQRPCVLSWFTISATRRALASALKAALALTSPASCAPSAVTGTLGPAGAATGGR